MKQLLNLKKDDKVEIIADDHYDWMVGREGVIVCDVKKGDHFYIVRSNKENFAIQAVKLLSPKPKGKKEEVCGCRYEGEDKCAHEDCKICNPKTKKTKVHEHKLPLHTAIWAKVYESLIKDGVKFPKRFDGIGAAYGGLCAIDKVLKEYKIV